MLEVLQSHHQTRGFGRTAVIRAVQGAKRSVKHRPVNQISQTVQFMAVIEHVIQSVAKQVGRGGVSGFLGVIFVVSTLTYLGFQLYFFAENAL